MKKLLLSALLILISTIAMPIGFLWDVSSDIRADKYRLYVWDNLRFYQTNFVVMRTNTLDTNMTLVLPKSAFNNSVTNYVAVTAAITASGLESDFSNIMSFYILPPVNNVKLIK